MTDLKTESNLILFDSGLAVVLAEDIPDIASADPPNSELILDF